MHAYTCWRLVHDGRLRNGGCRLGRDQLRGHPGKCVWTNDSPWGALRALAFGGTASDYFDLGSAAIFAPYVHYSLRMGQGHRHAQQPVPHIEV